MSQGLDVRFYGRRKGHELKPGRQRLVTEALPFLRLPEALPTDLRTLFARPVRDIWLEIGFGAGEHLVHQARTHLDIGFIGAEPYINGIGALIAAVTAPLNGEGNAGGIETVRIHDDDARTLLPRLPAASIGRLFVLFPDPWHKARHNKRRLISAETLDEFARILAPGAEFRFASDDDGYVRWTLARVTRHTAFVWTAKGPSDWRNRWEDAIATRYEVKNITGRKPAYLTFRRL